MLPRSVLAFAACIALVEAAPLQHARRPGGRYVASRSNASSEDVPCCPPFGPTPPPPFPAKYEVKWFTQPKDHFNFFAPGADSATFQQRYLYDARHWAGPPAPIIFVPCVEAGPAPYYYGEYGWVVDTLAKNLSALLVFAEHRGFGLTYPAVADGGDLSGWIPDEVHVGTLTEAQVLEDDTALATSLRTNLSAWDSPIIAVGGSLSGEMSTWWRIRYPFAVDMALAGSAPIFGFPGAASNGAPLCDQYAWMKVVTDAFAAVGGAECVSHMRTGYLETAGLSPSAVNAAFNPCTPATLPCHAAQLADLVMNWAPTAAELGSYPATNPARSQTVWACSTMSGATSGVDAYVRLLGPLAPGQCLNISWATSCGAADAPSMNRALASPSAGADGYCTTHWDDPSSGCQDGWGIESCTTEIHPIQVRWGVGSCVRSPPFPHLTLPFSTLVQSNNVTDFFPASGPFDINDRINGCRGSYGSNLRIDGQAMPRSFGQLDQARMATSASRIIFSSGQFDPWSSMSVNRSLSPTLTYVYIKGGAHHSDLGNNWNPQPAADDTKELIAARELEIDILNRWVRDFHEERAAAKAFLDRNEGAEKRAV